MPGKLEALGIFLFLLPGFACSYIARHLAVRRGQNDLDKVIEALLFSFLMYLVTLPFFHNDLPASWKVEASGEFHITLQYGFLLTLFLLSVAFGTLYAANINHDWGLAILRRLRVTERTARSAIWHDVFLENGNWVQVSMKDGKKALGWVRYYSDDAEDRSLFLEQASWIDDDGNEEKIVGPGLLLTKDSEIESVMFLDYKTSDSAIN